MGFNLQSGMGAGAGADMLQSILKQKFMEQQALAKFAEEKRQADLQNAVQQRQLGQGDQRLGLEQQRMGEDARQFDAQAPIRMANAKHIGAETDSLNRQPDEAQKGRDFSATQADTQRAFSGGQGDLNRSNAVKLAGIQGQNALAVANVRHPEPAGPTQAQQNEVQDTLDLIDQISKDPALNKSVGPIDQYVGSVISGDPAGVNRFRNLHNELTGKLQLAQAGKLKGQGQISDKEREMLRNAATALNPNTSEIEYRKELQKIRDQVVRNVHPSAMTGDTPHTGTISTEYDYVPGKGLIPRKQ